MRRTHWAAEVLLKIFFIDDETVLQIHKKCSTDSNEFYVFVNDISFCLECPINQHTIPNRTVLAGFER